MKILRIASGMILSGALIIAVACSGSKEDRALDKVAKDLGMDKKDLENKSMYAITITGGALNGQQFQTPVYAQGGVDSRWGSDKEQVASTIGFIDPIQGNTNFYIVWDDNSPKPLASGGMFDSENSFIQIGIKDGEQKYEFVSQSGTYNIKSNEQKTKIDQITKDEYPVWDIEADFEGEFKDSSTGGMVNIKGTVRGVNPIK